jgi:hypothetical protein
VGEAALACHCAWPAATAGGDHLIEMGHAWACAQCRSSFRCWPYGRQLGLWVGERGAAGGSGAAAQVPGPEGRQLYTYEL